MAKRIPLREKYLFDDFTEESYRQCLKMAKSRYRFITFSEFKADGRVCLWRHDIDTSPQRALKLGKIESQESVTSTYFFLFHSDRYNAFDYQVRDIMLELASLGHEIGLHFDPKFYGDEIQNETDLESNLLREKDILSEIIKKEVLAFSFHNPSTNKLLNIENEEIGGMVNAYNAYIKRNFEYNSDSFCYWRYKRLVEVLSDTSIEKLHILTHPVCWSADSLSPYARFKRAVDGRARATMRRYLQNAKKNNRKIIR